METIFKTDKNGNQRYTSIRVEKLEDGTANIIKATGVVDGKESISTTHVPLGYESALKRAKTIWKNLQVPDVMPMLANKWDDRKRYISEPFYVQPKLDGVRLLVSNKGGISKSLSFMTCTSSTKCSTLVCAPPLQCTIPCTLLRYFSKIPLMIGA